MRPLAVKERNPLAQRTHMPYDVTTTTNHTHTPAQIPHDQARARRQQHQERAPLQPTLRLEDTRERRRTQLAGGPTRSRDQVLHAHAPVHLAQHESRGKKLLILALYLLRFLFKPHSARFFCRFWTRARIFCCRSYVRSACHSLTLQTFRQMSSLSKCGRRGNCSNPHTHLHTHTHTRAHTHTRTHTRTHTHTNTNTHTHTKRIFFRASCCSSMLPKKLLLRCLGCNNPVQCVSANKKLQK